MKNEAPYPPPKGFDNADPKADATNDVAGPPYRKAYGKEGGHLDSAGDDFCDAVWNVPTGRRGD